MHPYRHDDYRTYLRDWYWSTKQRNPRLSFRSISRRLGLKAPNHFHLVISEKRHLSKPLFAKALQMLNLGEREKHFLKLLFQSVHARDAKEAEALASQIQILRKVAGRDDLEEEQYRLVAHTLAWHVHMAAAQFHGLKRADLVDRIKATSQFALVDHQVEEALRLLEKLGLMSQDSDTLVSFDQDDITTKWNFESDAVKAHHAGNLRLAMQTIPWALDKRFFTSVTVECTPKLREEIIGDLRTLCLKILEASKTREEDSHPSSQLVTLQIALFPFFDFARTTTPLTIERPSNSLQ